MAIFTAIGTAVAGAFFAGSAFAATAISTGLSLVASIGLSYAAKALAGDPNKDQEQTGVQGVQGTLQAGGDIPRSFNVGYSITAGSLVYANTWGGTYEGGEFSPNAYLTQVIAVNDLPGADLVEVWVNGELCTLGAVVDAALGAPVTQYNKNAADHLWVKYYDGTQTVVDDFVRGVVASIDRPYETTRVGVGVAYVVVTSLIEDTLFNGFPTFKWGLSGIPLYDPTKDDTNGGTGSHRWSDPATWGGDGDDFPAVQAYNILRGIYYNGAWLYGLQRMTAARLPAINWNAQIDKCRAVVTGEGGDEPTYRTGGQVSVNAQIVHTIEALLTGCQGRLSEIGGFYKLHLGSPDSPTFAFTDADILSTEEQNFAPFFGLSDSVNGITATYPSPAEGWNMKQAPPLFNTDFEAEDGDRRLLANPVFDFVPYDAQVQRLQKSALQEARRARRHSITLPPAWWIVEPGDVGEWSSFRNGYEAKQFRVDGVTDKANLDVLFNLTEVDPTDYDWEHATDYTGVSIGPTVLPRPAPQGVIDWFVEPYTLLDTTGQPRRAAILLSWDGNMPGVVGIQYEVRLAYDLSHVTRGRTDQLEAGALIISQSLIPDTEYEARGQYIPSAPRDMLWSDWLPVTTPAISVSLADFDAALHYQVVTIHENLNDKINEIEQRFATEISKAAALNWTDKAGLRDQSNSIRETLVLSDEIATAEINEVRTVAIGTEGALAIFETEVAATFGPSFSTVNSVSTAVATRDTAFAEYQTEVAATFGPSFSTVSSVSTAISTRDTAFSNYQIAVSAAFGTTNSNVTTNASAIATINGYAAAQYSVTLNVNGYATGFNLVNGGGGISSFTVVSDKFQIQQPGYNGSAPVPVFTVGTLNGVAAIGISANVYLDATMHARAIVAGSITSIEIAANTIVAGDIATGTITSASGAIGALSVQSLSIGDNAVIVPLVGALGGAFFGNGAAQTAITVNVVMDTTGLGGKPISTVLLFVGQQATIGGGGSWAAAVAANGSVVGAYYGGSTFQPSFTASGIHVFTASGGPGDGFTATAIFNAAAAYAIQAGTLTVFAAKR